MTSKIKIPIAWFALGVTLAITVCWVFNFQSGKLIARSKHGAHTVTVQKHLGRLNAQLSEDGNPPQLFISSYEFYEGSDPITAATVVWLESDRFRKFNNGNNWTVIGPGPTFRGLYIDLQFLFVQL